MKFLPDNMTVLEYLQDRNLRILSGGGYQYFREHLGDFSGNYLEIGVFEGVMLRELATTFPNKMFYGIDPFIEDGNTSGHNGGYAKGEVTVNQMVLAKENIKNRLNITLFQQTSRSFFEWASDEYLRYMDVASVFVDGDHSYDEARNDLFNSVRLLPNGGVMVIDDAELPDVKRAIADVLVAYDHRITYHYQIDGLEILKFRAL